MVGLAFSEENKNAILTAKAKKLSLVERLIKEDIGYIRESAHLNFLTPEQVKELSRDDIPVSARGHNEEITSFLEEYTDKIVLEFGAGHQGIYYDNIVNLEIMDYPSTDVRAYGESLPFKDESFDAVISNAVFEHVQDPFVCAKEISRVLKKGGKLFLGTAFMQPYHGFPHHYYNMTQDGLRNLFSEYLSIQDVRVGKRQKAVFSLAWYLGIWFNGLPAEAKRNFAEVKVKDLIQNPDEQMKQYYVKELSAEAEQKIAAGFTIEATK